MVFLGLSVVIHETSHLVVARALGYEAEVHYGIELPYLYGVVNISPSARAPGDKILIYSAGGLGAAAVFFILWFTIEDIVAKLLLSFFTTLQAVYGLLEPAYGFGLLGRAELGTIPALAGLGALVIFRVAYWRLGWW